MDKWRFFWILLWSLGYGTLPTLAVPQPKLIVIISIDQMRGDYLYRWDRFWIGGFRRLLEHGRSFSQCFYEHANCQTGPGHATLATGTYPAQHSIVTNVFYDRNSRTFFYCAEDSVAHQQGRSLLAPTFLKVPTLGDFLKEHLPRARVVSIAHKDRVAILTGGYLPDLVVWFDPKTGQWTHSAYYGDTLPQWLQRWAAAFPVTRWQRWQWTPMGSSAMYLTADSVPWEGSFPGGSNHFPHQLPDTSHFATFLKAYLCSPPAVADIFHLSEAAIEAESLGKDSIPDLLFIGISATDYLGHRFGPDSREIAELFLAVDRYLGMFLHFLDSTVTDYLLVLTADHGVCPIPEYLQRLELNAGRLYADSIRTYLESKFHQHFGTPPTPWVEAIVPPSVFLNHQAAEHLGIAWQTVLDSAIIWLSWYRGIHLAITPDMLFDPQCTLLPQQKRWLRNDIYPGRTGDILIQPQPFWIFGKKTAMHGYWYEYDRYVPLVFYGYGVTPGKMPTRCEPIDIVPTILQQLQLPQPAWLPGHPLPLQTP